MDELDHDGHSILHTRSSYCQYQLYPSEIAVAKIPWTSARCNRLLRPLSSKIALLRKEGQAEPEPNATRYATHISAGPSGNGGSFGCHKTLAQTAANADAEWESNPRPRKKIKRTYSAKTRDPSSREIGDNGVEAQAGYPGSEAVIGLPSQLTLEARPSETSAPIEGYHQQLKTQHPSNSRDINPSQYIPKDLAPNNWKLVDGVCKGLVALLKATDSWTTRSTSGCRSLFSTCLSQTPRYIAEEELLSKADDQDSDIDISSAVYSDLEEFGSMPGGGWEPLREVVRAHGIRMVTDAIEGGLLKLPIARHLFYLCLDVSAHDEAQCIIQSLTALATPTNQSLSKKLKQLPNELQMIVNSLDSLASRSGRQGFLYRHTGAMLDKGILPTTWISSKPMVDTWNGVIQSIAQEDKDAQSAAILLHTAIEMSYGKADLLDVHEMRLDIHVASHRPLLRSGGSSRTLESHIRTQRSSAVSGSSVSKEADCEIGSTLSNVLTVLSAITRLRVPAGPPSSSACVTLITTVLHDLSLGARRAFATITRDSSPNHFAKLHTDSLRLPLLAAGLAELSSSGCSNRGSHHQSPSLSHLAGLSSSNEASGFAGSLLCAVARCCGRARFEDPFGVIQSIVEDLSKASKSICYDAPTRKLCGDLALAAAFAYSEDTSRPNHLDWALQVELNLTNKGAGTPKPALVRTPARSIRQSKSGYRWEEGICEWIAKTPDLLLSKPSDVNLEIDGLKEPTSPMGGGLQETLLPSNDISPCAASKNLAQEAGRLNGGESKALHVLIQPHSSSCGKDTRPEKLSSINICQRSNKDLTVKSVPKIYEDNDLDELSAPASSQKETLALAPSSMQEPPNAFPGAKRVRRTDPNRNTHATKIFTLTSSIIKASQKPKHHHGLDNAEDELAVLFRW